MSARLNLAAAEVAAKGTAPVRVYTAAAEAVTKG